MWFHFLFDPCVDEDPEGRSRVSSSMTPEDTLHSPRTHGGQQSAGFWLFALTDPVREPDDGG